MKILLDENIDVRFKNLFDPNVHAVFTVKRYELEWHKKWNAFKTFERKFL